jgi:hypothetical protein
MVGNFLTVALVYSGADVIRHQDEKKELIIEQRVYQESIFNHLIFAQFK